jgi:AraC family transcriptional regulator of adaptative response/methylated-DNA-[protein]-cysteine methyltransferase
MAANPKEGTAMTTTSITSDSASKDDARWNAVLNRDAGAGDFVYGVVTTHIYCLPTCVSRRPLRKNVRFFDNGAAAEAAGFRACLRCRPGKAQNSIMSDVVRELARQIDAQPEKSFALADLARSSGYSRFHLQRNFKAIIGSTPKEYQTAARMRKLKTELRRDAPVANAIYEAGFGSTSRVYEKVDGQLGMTPSEYRSGAKGLTISYASGNTPLGLLMIGATDRGICFLQFGASQKALVTELERQFAGAHVQPMPATHHEQFETWMDALNRHLRGVEPHPDLPLDVRGTAFQLIVWRYLQKLPYGEVRSYSEVAAGIGKPSATRAVARACATNSIALLIPCHRVVRGSGELGGYRWGIDRKRVLLDTERTKKAVAGG